KKEDILMRKVTFICLMTLGICWISPAYADLTKQDIEEIRGIVREEIQRIDKRMDELKSEIKDVRTELKDFMLWGFGILFVGMFALVGFVLWDRRSALAPAIRKAKELEEEEEKIKKALRKYAIQEPKLAVVLREVGLA
ncbi:hypothetical protein KJ693_07810, partial [bacterium]|nr:hypothetical protein [bacterium]